MYFHPLEVVGRGSETQFQTGDNFQLYNLAPKKLPGVARLEMTIMPMTSEVQFSTPI